MNIKLIALLFTISLTNVLHSVDLMNPTSYSKDLYQIPILDGTYSEDVTHPDEFLGFGIGERVAAPWQITSALKTWSNESNRIKVIEYARTHEDRPLHAVFISSPNNIKNLEAIKQDITKLADARITSDRQAKSLIDDMPAVAWMAYSIHGNETSGADGALAAIYQASVPWCSILVRKAFGVAGAAHSPGQRFQYRYAWPSGDWGSLPVEGGVAAAYSAELENSKNPEQLLEEITERLNKVRSPFRTAEAFLVEEIIEPAKTRPLLCEFANLAAPLRGGSSSGFGYRP